MTAGFGIPFIGTLVVGTLLVADASAQGPADSPPPPPTLPAPEGVEVLARGPVHEAYAEPTEVRPQPSPLVTKQPPEPINELPPDQKPEGEDVQWIPGYWGWDQDQADYLWVSGFWRTPPPGRQWVPGNWQQVEGGWHWVPGFWGPLGQDSLQYLPPPPPSIDEGPSIPAPQADSSYVPGCWVHRAARCFWRPGFWMAYHPGWVWIPAHYVWTPGGCLFVEGYWDHPLDGRGLLFAPVRLAAGLLTAPGWAYTPQYVVQPDSLFGALFVQPSAGHYYFGDYFGARYQRAGFVPWVDYRVGRSGYDPNFNYYRSAFAGSVGWERGLRGLYQARLRGDIARPPRTLVQQNQVIQNITRNKTGGVAVSKALNFTNVQNVSVLTPLALVNNTRATNLASLADTRGGEIRSLAPAGHVFRLQPVPREQRVQHQQAAAQVHAVAQARRNTEARILSEGPPVRVTDRPRQANYPVPAARPPESRPAERPPVPRPGEAFRPAERPVIPAPPGRAERPAPVPNPRPGERAVTPPASPRPMPPAPAPARKVVPPVPTPPPHQDRPVPAHEPPRPPAPPKQVASPRPAPPAPPAPPPPKKPAPPPPPPKKELPKKS